MVRRRWKYLVGDFETTVYEGQTSTEVWASAIVPLNSEEVEIFHSIDETFDYLVSLKRDIICYYHNLKFDGSFWLHFLLKKKQFKQALIQTETETRWLDTEEMDNDTVKYNIAAKGQWYTIIIKVNNRYIEFRDSLKLLPFSVKKIGKSFGTKHKKLDMEYKGYRYAGCEITDKEKEYIANDVLVVKEALEIMFNEGHKKLTIGSCCLSEYKKSVKLNYADYDHLFPNLYEIPLDESYGSTNVGDYIKKSYHGGWCYLVKGKENKIYHKGTTADVNSLYPSMMSSESGNHYPTGMPSFIGKGEVPAWIQNSKTDYYFVRFKCRFWLKAGMLPTVQIKNNWLYNSNEWLETSDIYNKADGKYYNKWEDANGEVHSTVVEFTMTCTDYKLFQEHYNIYDFEPLDYITFKNNIGIFDDYIDKYKKIKMESKGAIRELAKLFLNNLYGKMAATTDSSFKIVDFKDDGSLCFKTIIANDKTPGYIAVGTAITSYARNFTIRTAQKNYHGVNKRGFIYADTDSIHCDLQPEELNGVPVHPTDFCHWKLESCWDDAIFVRQKTYIEHVTHEDLQEIDNPYYNVKCAGMPERSQKLLIKSLNGQSPQETDTEQEKEFLKQHRTLTDFRLGLEVPDCLKARQIEGGTLLVETTYKMRA